MSANNYDDLKQKFPEMYSNVYCGCDHPPGWDGLVWNLRTIIYIFDQDDQLRVAQTKEKFGGLRFYVDDIPEECHEIIEGAIWQTERTSFKTCQDCGEPGRVRDGGWVLTLCDECVEKRGKK